MTAFDVVTVIHNSAPQLTRLLESIERHAKEARVIVVDTGSTDDGAERAREWAAEVIELDHNPGFGSANNLGVQSARHDVTALLNPDVELLDDGLRTLVERAGTTAALLAPRLLNEDGTIQDSAHPAPGTWREVGRALTPPPLQRPPWRSEQRRRVGWATAAALVARTDTLKRLGPFDPHAFLWYEDMDLCLRAERVELHPDVTLRHTGGHSTGEDYEERARRRRQVVAQRRGRRAQALDDLAQAITFARAAPFKPRARAQLRALRRARG
ncbi:MAG TPA: glycosyltransferase [Solirubrobacteraceae bacterium]|jgi:N-acetylglucosaminyl-diphospho-decaprenol L-rhamnosyltransferase